MRIGLIADTHMPGCLEELWPQALDGFSNVDHILHAGDLHTLDIVDELHALAPICVAKGNGDLDIIDSRLKDSWLLELAGFKIGMIHRLPSPERKSPAQIHAYVERHFELIPDVIVFGHTHLEGLYQVGDMLCVNPGSPTLPRNKSLRMGSIGYLDIDGSCLSASIHQITDSGLIPHADITPMSLNRETCTS
ncbi:MAG: YfcE family phosphodiesterase [Pseudomonadales bacterium]|nr:YfcE family phosphodiesterase [Pseudomonadales bacterium]